LTTANSPSLTALARPSGGLAMLAIDHREALRAMMAEQRGTAVTDEDVTSFKLAAARALTPYASAVLLDKQFVLDQAIAQGAVAPGCGLIAAADLFIPNEHEPVTDALIDDRVDPAYYAARGAVAMKLLVIWRPDEDPALRVATVRRFVARCADAGLLSIIEPLSRAPRDGSGWDWDAGVLAAARELGDLGTDLYKAEVPLHGRGSDAELRDRCATLTDALACPWVVLSSGVRDDDFPRAVEIAMLAGATGFLAGRGVWRASLVADDVQHSLKNDAVERLTRLCEVVDRVRRG
jgi:sulfofructosephosphate aldolase